jgi:hypothetical protein
VWNTTGTVATLGSAGTDITTINAVPTLIDSLTFGEPYGELTGQITLPELAPFDAPAWLAAPADAPAPSRAAPAPVSADARAWATVEPGDWAELNRRVTPKGAAK